METHIQIKTPAISRLYMSFHINRNSIQRNCEPFVYSCKASIRTGGQVGIRFCEKSQKLKRNFFQRHHKSQLLSPVAWQIQNRKSEVQKREKSVFQKSKKYLLSVFGALLVPLVIVAPPLIPAVLPPPFIPQDVWAANTKNKYRDFHKV